MTLVEAIQALGNSPEEVTAKLREKGIKGYRRSACSCPIAKYMNVCGFPDVSVGAYVKLYESPQGDVAYDSHLLPPGVKAWIAAFDEGKHMEFCLPSAHD